MEQARGDKPVSVDIAEDAMRVTLRIHDDADVEAVTTAYCIEALREAGVSIDAEVERRINDLLAKVERDPGVAHEAVVAMGVPAQHAQDGRFEFLEGFGPDAADPTHDPDDMGDADEGTISYYAQSRFTIVKRGQQVGKLIPPTQGADGRTALGKTLAARTGKPSELQIDETLTVEPTGGVKAAGDGVLKFDKHSLQVLETLEIKEYVDFSTGNIQFPGDVRVGKGVRDCFVVEADGSIEVRGMVEAATLRTGRDLRLLGGMSAREKGTIDVGRDLEARYLGMVSGVVGRNATIDKEMMDCDLEVRGKLLSERCVVIGGRLCVTGVCQVGELGSDSGAPTEVVLGRLTALDRHRLRAERIGSDLTSRIQKLEAEEEQIKAIATRPAGAQAQRLAELRAMIEAQRAIAARLSKGVTRLNNVVERMSTVELLVARRINAGVKVIMGGFEVRFTRERKGPLRLYIDGRGKPHARDMVSEQPIDLSLCASIGVGRTGSRDPQQGGSGQARGAA